VGKLNTPYVYVRLAGTVGLEAGAVQDSRYALTVYLFVPCRVGTGRPVLTCGVASDRRVCPLLPPATASVARTPTCMVSNEAPAVQKNATQRPPLLIDRLSGCVLRECSSSGIVASKAVASSFSRLQSDDSKRDQPNISA